ncbi:hypothetical protein ACFLQN_04155 [Candidatus Aenigmatarchaeota archaeon]
MNYKFLAFILGILIFVSPVFADGTLNITKGALTTPSFINTKTVTPLFNLTFNVTDTGVTTHINVSSMFFNLTGTAYSGNISGIFIYNDTNNNGVIDLDDELVTNSNAWNETNIQNAVMQINFTNNISVLNQTEKYFIVALNLTSNAEEILTTGLNMSFNESVTTGDTATIIDFAPVTYIDSTNPQIQDVHASVNITPRYVDTGVENQTFSLTLTPTGTNNFTNISVIMPSGYELVQVTWIRHGTKILRNTSWTNTSAINITTGTTNFTIVNLTSNNTVGSSLGAGFGDTVTINYTVNTSLTALAEMPFNITLDGANLTGIAVDYSTNNINVTTIAELAKIESMTITKGTAIVNGTDYWEINYSINVSQDVSGLIHMRMSEWNATVGGATRNLNLTNATTHMHTSSDTVYYATFRNETNFATSNKINVVYQFNITAGIRTTSTYDNQIQTFIMRMVVPTGTPIASAWTSTSAVLFRSDA